MTGGQAEAGREDAEPFIHHVKLKPRCSGTLRRTLATTATVAALRAWTVCSGYSCITVVQPDAQPWDALPAEARSGLILHPSTALLEGPFGG